MLIILKKSCFNSRIEETNIQDFGFLYGLTNHTYLIIHENTMGRNIKIKKIDVDFEKCFGVISFLISH